MFKIETTWKGKGNLTNLISNLKSIDKKYAKYGYFSSQGKHPQNPKLNYPTLMAMHELREDGDPLKRPVFTVTLDKYGKKLEKDNINLVQSHVNLWARGKRTSHKKLLMGLVEDAAKLTQRTFGNTAMLTPNTIGVAQAKGKNSPMVDLGSLRDALATSTSLAKKPKVI